MCFVKQHGMIMAKRNGGAASPPDTSAEVYGHEQSEVLHRIGRSPAGGIRQGGGGPPDAPGGRGGHRGRGGPDGGHQPQRLLQV